MIPLILSYFFFVLASICNSIMDTSVHHYHKSIFVRFKDSKWWNGGVSWKNKYIDGDSNKGRVKWILGINKPVQLTDAWHFFKMLMIIFICLSMTLVFFSKIHLEYLWLYFIYFISLGFTWNTIFSLFYNKILKNKKWITLKN